MNRGKLLVIIIITAIVLGGGILFLNSRAQAKVKAQAAIEAQKPENILETVQADVNKGNFEQAMAKVNKLVKEDPTNLNFLAIRIKTETLQADALDALAQEHYYSALGRSEIAKQRTSDAVKNDLVEQWDVLPYFVDILISRARIYDKVGNPREAQLSRQQAATIKAAMAQEQARRDAIAEKRRQEEAKKTEAMKKASALAVNKTTPKTLPMTKLQKEIRESKTAPAKK